MPESDTGPASVPSYRKQWLSWALYDVANSAFYLVVIGSFFPIFYQEVFIRAQVGIGVEVSEEDRKSLLMKGGGQLALTALIATAIIALLGPILGTIADRYRAKKRFLAYFACFGVLCSALMLFIGKDSILLASFLYAAGTVGVAGSIVFYDSLLPSVAREGELDRISTASSGPALMEMLGTGETGAPHLPDCYDFRKGRLYPKDKPGLGVEFDPSSLEQVLEVTERSRPIPLHRRPDGSITNW